MSESLQLSELVAAARDAWQPDDAARARVRSGVLLRVGVAVAAGTTAVAGASSAGAAAGAHVGAGLVAKLLVSIAIVGGVGTAGYVAATRQAPAPATVPALSSAPPKTHAFEPIAAADRPAIAMPPDPSPVEVVAPTPPPPTGDRPPRASAGMSGLRDQLAMLRAAMRAFEAGDPGAALAKADAYDTSFPDGELRPEIAAVRIDALCALGRRDQAARASRRFLEQWPESPLAERVRASCGTGGVE